MAETQNSRILAPGSDPEKITALLRYLQELIEYLPQREKELYASSKIPASLKTVLDSFNSVAMV